MRFGCHAGIQGQFHSPDDNLFVVMKEREQGCPPSHDHRRAGAASGPATVERPAAIQEGSTIAQGTRLALDNGESNAANHKSFAVVCRDCVL